MKSGVCAGAINVFITGLVRADVNSDLLRIIYFLDITRIGADPTDFKVEILNVVQDAVAEREERN